MTHLEQGHYVVWNEFGEECQSFYFHLFYRLVEPHLKKGHHSYYHMADYSFSEDLLYLGRIRNFFVVIPEIKEDTFRGNLFASRDELPQYESGHLFVTKGNLHIWLLGNDYQTKVLSLE